MATTYQGSFENAHTVNSKGFGPEYVASTLHTQHVDIVTQVPKLYCASIPDVHQTMVQLSNMHIDLFLLLLLLVRIGGQIDCVASPATQL